jgi:hypothetical protein
MSTLTPRQEELYKLSDFWMANMDGAYYCHPANFEVWMAYTQSRFTKIAECYNDESISIPEDLRTFDPEHDIPGYQTDLGNW